MNIQAGKKYRTRDGRVVGVADHTDVEYPFRVFDGYDQVTVDREGYRFEPGRLDRWDLVSEILIALDPTPQPGEEWETRGGNRVRIVANDIPGDQPIAGHPIDREFEDSESRVWTFFPDGRVCGDTDDEDDLVRPVPQPVVWMVRERGEWYATCGTLEQAESWREADPEARTIHPLYEKP